MVISEESEEDAIQVSGVYLVADRFLDPGSSDFFDLFLDYLVQEEDWLM